MTNANAISRALRAGDFKTSSPERQYKHEGLFVRNSYRGSGAVTVHVDIDHPSKRRRLVEDIAEWLREKGYTVEPCSEELSRLYVTGSAKPRSRSTRSAGKK